jgi:carbamoyl-phosphate synthase large subunit
MTMNLLFSCAGRRAYLLKYFRKALDAIEGGRIIATDMQLSAPALAFADVALQVPSVYDANYIDITLEICRKYEINALFSLNDLELPILAAAQARFFAAGTRPVLSSPEVIELCFDKFQTHRFISSIGLNSPKTFIDLIQAKSALERGELSFPLVLKPRWGSGSIGIEFVSDIQELDETYSLLKRRIRRSILAKASVRAEDILIQEALLGPEYGLDIMNDLQGIFASVCVKRKLAMRSGETDKAITVDEPEIASIGKTIALALRHVANLDADVIEHDGRFYVLELNPRFGGGYPFSHEAGVDLPLAILKWLRGQSVPSDLLRPTSGLAFSKCDTLISIPNS